MSELDRITARPGDEALSALDLDQLASLFTDAFVLWRHGYLEHAQVAIQLGREWLQRQPCNGLLTLRLAQVLLAEGDPDGAFLVRKALDLGTPVHRSVRLRAGLGAGETAGRQRPALTSVCALHQVLPASVRSFPPARGDGRHPAFDFAAEALPPLDVTWIDGGVFTLDMRGADWSFHVTDRQGRVLEHLSMPGRRDIAPDIEDWNGEAVLLDDGFLGMNVAHALFDKLPRWFAYAQVGPVEALTPILFRREPYYGQALAALGVDRYLAPKSELWSVRARRLGVLSNHRRGEIMHPMMTGAPELLTPLRERLAAQTPGRRRIFVSRRDAERRAVQNAEAMEAVFAARGFDIHILTGLDFEAQADLFRDAAVIAGVHGAGLANMVFAHHSTKVFEILPPLGMVFAYWVMAGRIGCEYWSFVAEDARLEVRPGATCDPLLNDRMLHVDVPRLEAMLDRFLA